MSLSKPKYKKKLFNVDINLIDILEIDVEKQVIIMIMLLNTEKLLEHIKE